jgi:hypothetical protein
VPGILEKFSTAEIAPPAQPAPRTGILGQFATTPEATPRESVVAENIGQDFAAGLSSGTDQLQATFFSLSRLVGRELGIEGLEDFSQEGLDRNLAEAQEFLPSVQAFSQVEDIGSFFRWASAALGQAAPSLGLAMASGGIGGAIGRKAVENSIRDTIRNRMVRNMAVRGVSPEQAEVAASRVLASSAGFKMLRDGMTRGAQVGVFAGSAGPQIGEADIALTEAGVDSGFSSILAGVAGGLLEIAPAVRLLDKVFPGVDKAVSANFVKDFAKFAGVQGVLEGSTEGMQEVIQLAALAYHDPTFDMLDPANVTQVLDSFAAGALVGVVTGGLGGVAEAVNRPLSDSDTPPVPTPTIPEFDIGRTDEILPEGFEPADNTVFQEVRSRVDNIMQEKINPAMNAVQESFQTGVSAIAAVVPAVNAKVEKMANIARKAHDEFIEGHRPVLDDAKRYAAEQIGYITERARAITDPAARQKFIDESVAEVNAQVSEVATELGNRARKIADSVTTQVNGISVFDDEFTNPETVQTDTEFVFGKMVNKQPTRGEQAQPLKKRKSARELVRRLKKRFPSADDSTFGIREVEGGYVVVLEDSGQREALIEDELVSQGVDNARQSGRTSPNKFRQAEVKMQGVTGRTRIDVPTLIYAGRKLDSGDNQTIQQGFLAMAGRLLDRGIIGDDGFVALKKTFDRLYPDQQAREQSIRQLEAEVRLRNAEFDPSDITPEVDPEGELNRDTVAAREEQLSAEAADLRRRSKPAGTTRTTGETAAEQRARLEAEQARDEEAKAKRAPQKPKAKRAPQKPKAKRAPQKPKAKRGPVNQQKLTSDVTVQVYMPGDPNIPGDKPVSGVIRAAINSIANRVAKLFGGPKKIRIINKHGAMRMIQDKHEHAAIAEALLNHSDFAVSYNQSGLVYILVDNFDDAGVSITALIHELGHVLHYDTWESLSKSEQDKLWDAFAEDVNSGKRTTGRRINRNVQREHPPAMINNFEFSEWMADQFVDWMNNRRQPKTAIEKFMETVAQKLDQVWAFISKNPGRFNQLNQTYADFADAVALRVRNGDPTGNGRWFQNEGEMGRTLEELFSDARADRILSEIISEAQGKKPPGKKARPRPAKIKVTPEKKARPSAEGSTPRGVTPKEWTALKTRVEKEYPLVVARAKAITEWLHNAYHLVLAPSTSVMRSLAERGIKSADKLVNIFSRAEHGKPKLTRNYHQRIKLIKGRFTNAYENITQGMKDDEKVNLLKRMREMDGDPEAKPRTLKERQMRRLFDEVHMYMRDQGLPVGKIPNYFPRTFSMEKLIANEEKIIDWYMNKTSGLPRSTTRREAQGFFNSLVSDEAAAAAALAEMQVDELSLQSPSFRNMRSRTARDTFFDQFLDDNLDGVMSNYIVAATKRGEFNRALGSKAPPGVIGGDRLPKDVWNPQGQLDQIMADAKEEGATKEDLLKMKNYIDANLGQYGRDLVPDSVRTAMATVVAYQNMRLLLFTVFASLPDLVGPAIRSGDMKGAFQSFAKNIKKTLTTQNELDEMARAWGMVSSAFNQHIMTEYVDNHYMPPTARKWNEAFFKWTGLNFYTDFTRKMALAVGRDTLKAQAAKVNDQSISQKQRDRAKQFLAEFGLTADSVTTWVEGGERVWGGIGYDQESANDQQIAEALVQFVDESIMSPNASQRPIAASHPALMLVYHLKGYIYAIYDTILKRLAHNFKIADTPAQVLAAVAPAILMIALTALGLELRELVTGDRRTDRMDGWEYTWTTIERSGLLGISQLAFDFEDAGARGQAEFAAMSGPMVSQLGDLISKPFSQTIPKAIPVVSQLPWARNALREATPL